MDAVTQNEPVQEPQDYIHEQGEWPTEAVLTITARHLFALVTGKPYKQVIL